MYLECAGVWMTRALMRQCRTSSRTSWQVGMRACLPASMMTMTEHLPEPVEGFNACSREDQIWHMHD